jgi:homogentisate 1,2-dioxygenase
MSRFIPVSRVEGRASRQAHADLPPGTYEREMSKEGFFGPAAFFHHRHPPTGWTAFEGPLRPHAFDLAALEPVAVAGGPDTGPAHGADPAAPSTSPWDAHEVLANAHCRLRFWRLVRPMDHLARNADGDELVFVHRGTAELHCDFGHLTLAAGDYLVLPRGTMWRLDPGAGSLDALLIEATNAGFGLPDRGLAGPHALFDPAMLDVPRLDDDFAAQADRPPPGAPGRPWTVRVKRRNAVSVVTYPFNPLDAVGWHGELAPVRLNVRDLRPLMSHRYHLPPSAHTTFVAPRFVVCTFVPRPFESDPGALKVPFFHNNDDYDEVIFYHAGEFFSRDGIRPGMATFHPAGFTHGPHPKALTRMLVQTAPATDEYAVMIDTRDALEIAPAAQRVEWPGYVDSWRGSAPAGQ